MKRHTLLSLALVFLFFSTALGEEFQLTFKSFKDKGFDVESPSRMLRPTGKPASLQKEPKYRSNGPLFFSFDMGSDKITLVLDEKKKGDGHSVLILDKNRDNNLANDKAVAGKKKGSEFVPTFEFPICSLDVKTLDDSTSYPLRAVLTQDARSGQAYLTLHSRCCLTGKARLGEEDYNLVLFDSNCNGSFGDFTTVKSSNLDGDKVWLSKGKASLSNMARIYAESIPLCQYTLVDGSYFTINLKGKTANIAPSDVETGILKNGYPDYNFHLVKNQNVLYISSGNKEVPVPVGKYQVMLSSFASKGKKKSLWTLEGIPFKSKSFSIADGQTTDISFGPPLALKISADRSRLPKTYTLSFKLLGSGGEQYSSILKNGKRVIPPSFKIFPQEGKVPIHKGKFHYG